MTSKSVRRHHRIRHHHRRTHGSGPIETIRGFVKRLTGRGRRVHRGGRRKRHVGRRMVMRRMRGNGGHDITGQIPLLGGLIQSIGDAIHHGTDW